MARTIRSLRKKSRQTLSDKPSSGSSSSQKRTGLGTVALLVVVAVIAMNPQPYANSDTSKMASSTSSKATNFDAKKNAETIKAWRTSVERECQAT